MFADRSGASRVKGKKIALGIDGVNWWADAATVVIEQDEDLISSLGGGDIANTGDWHMSVTAIQSTDPGSLWMLIWLHEFKPVDYVYAPHGNEDPSEVEPHFTGSMQVPSAPKLGGEAGEHTTYSFDVQFRLDGKPTLITN